MIRFPFFRMRMRIRQILAFFSETGADPDTKILYNWILNRIYVFLLIYDYMLEKISNKFI